MHYIVDGHNLIPWMPGISLTDPDDEKKLVDRLEVFCRNRQHTVEVFFDRATTGWYRQGKQGRVTIIPVRASKTADDAIKEKLYRLGMKAVNITVVSSDRQVQAEAKSLRSKVIISEAFARLVEETLLGATEPDGADESPIPEEEVKYWEEQFRQSKKK